MLPYFKISDQNLIIPTLLIKAYIILVIILLIKLDCVGRLLDGTHIHQSIPSNIITYFRGQKSYPTQSVLATGDSEIRFTYI